MREGEVLKGDNGASFKLLEPIAYRGKAGCQDPGCTRDGNPARCYGWHCSRCDEPCSMMGHRCEGTS
jgi:hypothetical protein